MSGVARLALASKALAKGVKMKTAVNPNAETAFYRVLTLAGGAEVYTESTKSAIWAECHRNEVIQTLAGRYLFSSFSTAERALGVLDEKLKEVFGL